MKKTLALLSVAGALLLSPMAASAQERLQDGLLGAGAGALVGGPVGAVVGGAVGYSSGPHIANGLGVGGRRHYRDRRYSQRRYEQRQAYRRERRGQDL